jgi:hypothetical protein
LFLSSNGHSSCKRPLVNQGREFRAKRKVLIIKLKQFFEPGEAMKITNNTVSVRARICSGALLGVFTGVLLVASASQCRAQYNLSVEDTSLQVNLGGGLSDWTLNGVNQLDQQWFYYSVGANPVYSIDTISAPSAPTFGGQVVLGTLVNTNITTTYADSTLSVKTKYTLGANASGATLSTVVTLDNLTGSSQTFNFYQFSHFGLGGSSTGQNVHFLETTSPYEVTQTGNGALLTGTVTALAGGVSSPVEEIAGVYDGTQFGLENGNPAPNFTDTSLSATGNVDYAYQFTATLASGGSLTISEIQSVPEPSALAMVLAGMLTLGLVPGGIFGFRKKQ